MEPQKNNMLKKGAISILAVGLIAGVGFYLSQEKNKSNESLELTTTEKAVEQQTPPQTTEPVKVMLSMSQTTGSLYKDGAYQASGSYSSPAGKEVVNISLTLKDDTIVAATFKGEATNPASKNWQGEFSKGFTQAVVGEKITDVSLTVVNGSSLTPKGFMSALVTIKAEAKI